MDLYQIFTTHNRPWTLREAVCFSLLFSAVSIFGARELRQKRIRPSQLAAALLLTLFLGFVFASTVFTREPDGVHNYELELFWSWKRVLSGNTFLLMENLLNLLLLFPMGLLLPAVCSRRLPWYTGLFLGAAVSSVIEILQLVLCRGLFEWDDIIHNGLGCMAGCVLAGAFMENRRRARRGKSASSSAIGHEGEA